MRGWVLAALLLWAVPAAAQDMIDLRGARIIASSPQDVAQWQIGVVIKSLTFDPRKESELGGGLRFDFQPREVWPDYTPPGWNGPIQYTVWACGELDGWVCGGFIQMWRDRPGTGAPPGSHWYEWAYDNVRHAPLTQFRPAPGVRMAFFLTAGNARDNNGPTSVRERSQVVLVTLPQGDSGVFTFNNTSTTPPASGGGTTPTTPPPSNTGGGMTPEQFQQWATAFQAWAQDLVSNIKAQQEYNTDQLRYIREAVDYIKEHDELQYRDIIAHLQQQPSVQAPAPNPNNVANVIRWILAIAGAVGGTVVAAK